MGSRVGDRCFASASDAADQFFSAEGVAVTSGATSYVSYFEKVSGAWMFKRYSVASDGSVTVFASSPATVPAFPACDTAESFNDGLVIGWAVAGAMLAAYAVKFIAKGLQRGDDI